MSTNPAITLYLSDTQVSTPDPDLIRLVLDSKYPPRTVAQPSVEAIPDLGEYWAGQGGINGGFVPERDGIPAHYLIFAAEDAGTHAWGGYDKSSSATSRRDGLANTQALVNAGGYPAAEAAVAYTADGHSDFCLPSQAELMQGWLNCPDAFEKAWYWSSTQYSASYAFSMGFEYGWIDFYGKLNERRVRPARRLLIIQ